MSIQHYQCGLDYLNGIGMGVTTWNLGDQHTIGQLTPNAPDATVTFTCTGAFGKCTQHIANANTRKIMVTICLVFSDTVIIFYCLFCVYVVFCIGLLCQQKLTRPDCCQNNECHA
jgi:hypothetical protein